MIKAARRLGARIGQAQLLTLAVLVVYLIFPTRKYYWDGVKFALNIETPGTSATALLDPNHLVYSAMGYFVWKLLAAVGVHLRALFVLQLLNGVFAAAAVNLAWRVILRVTNSEWHSTWCSLILAFSATWWMFSTDADAYIPSIFFLILTVHLLMRPRPRAIEAGLAHATAMVLHQLAFLFLPAALIAILHGTSKNKARKGVRLTTAGVYGLTALALTIAAYVSAYCAKSWPASDVRGFRAWITSHAADASFSFDLVRGAILSIRGNVRLFLGGRFNLVYVDIVSIIAGLSFILLIIMLLRDIVGTSSIKGRMSGKPPNGFAPAWSAADSMSVMWATVYLGFLLFWLPQNTFYRLFYLPALIILMAGISLRSPVLTKWLPVVCATMFAWNFLFDIYPYTKPENNSILTFALDHQSDWTAGTMVAYSQFHTDLWTISYFNPQASWVAIQPSTIEEVESLRAKAVGSGKPIWLEATAWSAVAQLPAGHSWLDEHSDPHDSLVLDTSSHKVSFYRLR